ncbi:MAG: nucleotidyl transferase AbiEii/AbiGii toxin family protein [Pseudarthrobacter sp.]|nr:nucleotidyl transferase AbiEii/AbiGii toxin family protein [Pseudarthrobacter sp.]
MRDSLDAKFRSQSATGRLDAGQLRRRFVFQRVLRRLGAAGGWVLKGGFLLEVRIPAGARATKDMDFATAPAESQDELLERIEDALEVDDDGDFLTFSVQQLKANRLDRQGLASWSVSVRADLDGREFDRIKVDIAERLEEIDGGTESLTVAPFVDVDGLGAAELPAVDVCQHAAEKFHALCLEFDDGRPNTRTKDLVDIVLLFEAGLIPHERLTTRIEWVFLQRDHTTPPPRLPDIPASWEADYEFLARDLDVGIRVVVEAHGLAQKIYQDAVAGLLEAPKEGNN